MNIIIEDGAGSGTKAKVNNDNRLITQAITESEQIHATEIGTSYNLNTGNITFSTSGSFMYLKNNEDVSLVIESLAIGVGTAATSDMGEITIVRGPTGGDIISDATVADINVNRNFGSSKTLSDSLVYKGKSGGTLTGGNDILLLYQGTSSRLFANINLLLPKGTAVGISYDPKLSSGSVKGYAALIVHQKSEDS